MEVEGGAGPFVVRVAPSLASLDATSARMALQVGIHWLADAHVYICIHSHASAFPRTHKAT